MAERQLEREICACVDALLPPDPDGEGRSEGGERGGALDGRLASLCVMASAFGSAPNSAPGRLVRRRSSPPAGIKARFQPYARSLQEQLDISQLAFSAPQAPAVGAGDGAGGRYSLF